MKFRMIPTFVMGGVMFKKSILLSVLLFSIGAFGGEEVESISITRLANKCWNTKLSEAEQEVCSKCEVDVEKKYEASCSDEIDSADYIAMLMEMVVDDGEVYAKMYPLWSKALTLRDNCKIEMVNSCFLKAVK